MNGPQSNITNKLRSVQSVKAPTGIEQGWKKLTLEHRKKISDALMGRETMPAIERFMSHVDKQDGGCWGWFGAKTKKGYGSFVIKKNNIVKGYRAHRWSYVYFVGYIPNGLTLDHLCKNPSCVNPSHLEAVTLKENLLRGDGFSGQNSRKLFCKRNHVLVPIPLTRKTSSKRYCPVCENEKALAWNKTHREQKNKNNRRYYKKTYQSTKKAKMGKEVLQ